MPLATTSNGSLLDAKTWLSCIFVFYFWNHIWPLFFPIWCCMQQVFLDPKKFLGVASVADAVEYLHSGRSVGKVRLFLQAYNNNRRTYYFCSNTSCNFQCYLFRSSFAWIHPTARPLLSYSAQTYELHCQQKDILLRIPRLSDWKMAAEFRRMFRLGSI